MSSAVHESANLENWLWLGLQIRCALLPNEPRLIDHYLAEGRYLARFTPTSPNSVAHGTFRLLLETALDQALPWHWRSLCLDQAWRPLRDLRNCAAHPAHIRQWQDCAHQLACCELLPSIPLTDLLQGYCDE
ncbi:FagA protein [Pseudomonas baltica]|uniref:FagA protein n=1 Tax=Pseudomonas baltica TaxID=2762576 RepID=A0A7X1KTB2_9PSED|nr:FagA protein [Pseudomonas baltica]MBC2678448.1 FagA protein [Pseudomonas baltica]